MPNRINLEINIEQLAPFANHPFKLYEGQRFSDMVESIRANGVITPIMELLANPLQIRQNVL